METSTTANLSRLPIPPGSPNDPNFVYMLGIMDTEYPHRDEAWRRESARQFAIRVAEPQPDYSGKSDVEVTGERISRIRGVLVTAYGRTMPEAWAVKAADEAVDRLVTGINEARAQMAR